MPDDEAELFARFEREFSADLSEFRKGLLDEHDLMLVDAVSEWEATHREDLDLAKPRHSGAVRETLRQTLQMQWPHMPGAPLQGAWVEVSGGLFQVYHEKTRSFSFHPVEDSIRLNGIMKGVDSQPFVAQEYLSIPTEAKEKVELKDFMRPFGLHLILHSPFTQSKLTNELAPTPYGIIYLPLHYDNARIHIIDADNF